MSNKKFDPNKTTVEGIFRAKKEWRRRMANLPFEEKIEIVKQLQAVARTMRESNHEDRAKHTK